MRKLAGVLLIIAVPIAAVLGGLLLLSSQYQKVMASVEANDLSAVAGDLISPEELAKQKAAAAKRVKKTKAGKRGARQRIFAYALIGAAQLMLVGGVLSLLGRLRVFVIGLCVLGGALSLTIVIAESANALSIAASGCSVVAFVLAALSKRETWRAGKRPPDKAAVVGKESEEAA